jgi:TPR repeat protein
MGAKLVLVLKETSSYAQAHQQLVEACQLDERESCHHLANAELTGTFGTRDESLAARHFWQACGLGLRASCAAIAYLVANGIGVEKDRTKAEDLTFRACALGYEPACESLRHPERNLPPPVDAD